MSDHDHDHHDHDHDHEHGQGQPPEAPGAPMASEDAGSQALSEALRSSFAIVKVVMGFLFVVFLFSGFFTVAPQERAIILRFGNPVGEGNKALLGPRKLPYWSFPYPIDEVVKIPITEIQTVKSTVGWYATTPELEALGQEPPAGPSLNPALDGYAITGDGNIIHTRATLSYRIEDPIRFEFDFANASNAVQNVLDNALLYVAARYKVDDVLTRDIAGFREKVQARVTELADRQKLGIVVEQCSVESRAPRQCKAAFDAVLTAVSTRDTVHNEAVKYENQVLSLAAAEAASRTNSAEAERIRLVGAVRAEAERFTKLLPSYQADPALFAKVLLSEKIGQVLSNAQDKWYVPENLGGGKSELRLQFSREPLKPAASTPPN